MACKKPKPKNTKHRVGTSKRKNTGRKSSDRVSQPGSESSKQRKKYARGGRIEAYTFGEALKNPKWPF